MTKPRRHPWVFALGLALFTSVAGAQNTLDNPDWVEEKVAPPPAFSKTNLIPIVMPSYISTQIGVDPATVVTGGDGIVRYVVVMTNATGTVNAFYEGIRCLTDEVKTYARVGSSGEWSQVAAPQWKHVNDNQASRHSHAIARQGACHARLALSAPEIVKALKDQEVAYKRYQLKQN